MVCGDWWYYLAAKHVSPLIPATSHKSQESKTSGCFNGSSAEEQELVKIAIKIGPSSPLIKLGASTSHVANRQWR
jgi:hypothetical protein